MEVVMKPDFSSVMPGTVSRSRWWMAAVVVIAALFVFISELSADAQDPAGQPPGEGRRRIQAVIERNRQNYRLFFGLDAPKYETSDQTVQRLDMTDDLTKAVTDHPNLDTKDPTAGIGGSLQHSRAALPSKVPLIPYDVPISDLGYLLRSQHAPADLAEQGNYYAKLTVTYEESLRERIKGSKGDLAPADVMRMALDTTHGNYTLAALTAHNLLKSVAYLGREAAEDAQKRHRDDPNHDPEQLEFLE